MGRAATLSLIVVLLAVGGGLLLQHQRQKLDQWYQRRLQAMGFWREEEGGGGGLPSFVLVEPVVPWSATAFRAEARHLVQLGDFRQFLAKSKMPYDERWVFAADTVSGKCPAMTFEAQADQFERRDETETKDKEGMEEMEGPDEVGNATGAGEGQSEGGGKMCLFNAKPAQALWTMLQGGVHHRREELRFLGSRSSFFRADFVENGDVLPAFAADARAAAFLRALDGNAALVAGAKTLFNGTIVRSDAVYGNLLLPGQELPLHTDVPAFRGLNRGVLPSWVLTAMHNSRLFDRWLLHIATAVLVFPSSVMEKQEQEKTEDGGEDGTETPGAFVFHPRSLLPAKRRAAPTRLNSAMMTDADSIFHGTNAPARDAPAPTYISKSSLENMSDSGYNPRSAHTTASRVLFDVASQRFRVVSPDGALLSPRGREPGWDEIRFSISWKAFVFKDAHEAALYDEGTDALTVDMVFDMFAADLRARHGVHPARADHLAFAHQIIAAYDMPYYLVSNAWNPCAAVDIVDAIWGRRASSVLSAALAWVCASPPANASSPSR